MTSELQNESASAPGALGIGDSQSQNPYAAPKYVAPASAVIGGVRPHRGTTIFVMGLLSIIAAMFFSALGFVFAVPLGSATLWMARRDFKLMAAGAMDNSGRGFTQGGMVCAIVGIGWSLFTLLLTAGMLVFIFGIEYAQRMPR